MATQTLVSAQAVSTTITSPVLTVSGSIANATIAFDLTVPFGDMVEFDTEFSTDGGATWLAKDSYSIDNRSGTKTTHFTRTTVVPNEIGTKMRSRVTQIVGTITVNSITLTN